MRITSDLETPPARCPYCEIQVDRIIAVSEKDRVILPQPDDVSVCMSCAQFIVFDAQLQLRKPTPAELQQCAGRPLLRRMSEFIKKQDRRPPAEPADKPAPR